MVHGPKKVENHWCSKRKESQENLNEEFSTAKNL